MTSHLLHVSQWSPGHVWLVAVVHSGWSSTACESVVTWLCVVGGSSPL